MKLILKLSLFLFLSVSFSCCDNSEETITTSRLEISPDQKEEVIFSSPEKLVSYVLTEENGYYKEKEIDEIKYTALLKPIEYIKASQLVNSDGVTVSPDDDLQYFDLRITVKEFGMEFLKYNLPNSQTYYNRVNYCAFDMQKDIYLVDGRDTLRCAMFHFERAYDVVPFGHFILAFAPCKSKNITTKTLVYYDRLFNKGLIKFTFSPYNLVKSPKLISA